MRGDLTPEKKDELALLNEATSFYDDLLDECGGNYEQAFCTHRMGA